MNRLARRVVERVLGLLRTGLTPRELAWSTAAGLVLGVLPMPGITTLLGLGVALLFGLNQPALQLANYLAYPLQLVLLVPFFRMGGRACSGTSRCPCRSPPCGAPSGWIRSAPWPAWGP